MKVLKITAHSFVGDYGQMVDEIRILTDGSAGQESMEPKEIVCTDCYNDVGASRPCEGVSEVSVRENEIILKTDPFLYRCDFSVSLEAGGQRITVNRESIDEVEVYHSELFRAVKEDGFC